MEETIAYYSDALPYAIVPNANEAASAGTPYGNNPSGSALGAIRLDSTGAEGSYIISDWTYYLSQAFGAGVHPAFAGSVTKVYPFNFLSTVQGSTVVNNYNGLRSEAYNGVCGGTGPIKAVTGEIKSIKANSL